MTLPETSQPETAPRKQIPIGSWIRTLFLILVFYVLSSGPAFKAVQVFNLPAEILRVYRPLIWCFETDWGSKAKPALKWYLETVWKVDAKKRVRP